MIIVKLSGGLGNQMFQYALGRNLSLKNKTTLYIDASDLLIQNNIFPITRRSFELNIFNTNYRVKSYQNKNTFLKKIINKFRQIKNVKESIHLFNPDVLNLKGNIILDGYWQCENYFNLNRETILSDFTFKIPPDKENEDILNCIKNVNSVSVHFRRGDYVSNVDSNNYHGICADDYYYTAIKILQEKISNPYFYIFSDEIETIKSNFKITKNVTFINHNYGKKNYEDLRLMSACKHNIIANSSFSWWGAWLNRNENKIVIAPKNWFRKIESDIVPPEWIKI